jgi:hypothetical protein
VAEPTRHGFCPLHRIGFDRDLDPVCPQCILQRVVPPESLDFDVVAQLPLNAQGKHLNPRTLKVAV